MTDRDDVLAALRELLDAYEACDNNRGAFSCVEPHDCRCPKSRSPDGPIGWRGEWVCKCGRERLDTAVEWARAVLARADSGPPRGEAGAPEPPSAPSEAAIQAAAREMDRLRQEHDGTLVLMGKGGEHTYFFECVLRAAYAVDRVRAGASGGQESDKDFAHRLGKRLGSAK